MDAPEGSKYDAWAAVVQAALATPEGTPREGPAAALLRSLEGFLNPSTGALPKTLSNPFAQFEAELNESIQLQQMTC